MDLGNGTSLYSCDETILENKINEIIIEKNLQAHYSYIKSWVQKKYADILHKCHNQQHFSHIYQVEYYHQKLV